MLYLTFTQDVKTAVSDCWTSVQAIHAKQAANVTRYLPDVAEQENKKLDADKAAAATAAKERVNSIADKADKDAGTLDEINPFSISDDYMKLLGGAFDLTIPQVQHIATECQKSPTMLSAIDAYCKRHEMRLNRATAESRRSGIAEIRASALSVVSKIESTNYRNGGHDLSAPLVVENFCKDGDFANELYGRLGQRFSGEIIPPVVEPENPMNFHFRGVRDGDKKAG